MASRRTGFALALVGCWSATDPVPPAPAPIAGGHFHLVVARSTHCQEPAVEHAGHVNACGLEFDATTGAYVRRTLPPAAILADGRLVSKRGGAGEGLFVDAQRIETGHIYKVALSPDGTQLAYIKEWFEPDYHQTIVVRETARWTKLLEVTKPRFDGESYDTALGFLATGALMVTIASPSCAGRNPCSSSRLAPVAAAGVGAPVAWAVAGAPIDAHVVAVAPDGTAVALATATHVHVLAPDGGVIGAVDLHASGLDSARLLGVAVAPGGRALAVRIFDHHGVVVLERRASGYAIDATVPELVSHDLAFSRAGDAVFTTGDGLNILRRTRTPPVVMPHPALALDATGFAVEDCADDKPEGFECGVDHQLRARFVADPVTVTIHVSPKHEFAPVRDLDAWTRQLRERFELAPADIREKVDLGLRAWQTPRGRQLEYHYQRRESCRPADLFVRFAEVDDYLWRVEIAVAPDAPQVEVDPLLARFLDRWLGPPAARIARVLPGPQRTATTCMTF